MRTRTLLKSNSYLSLVKRFLLLKIFSRHLYDGRPNNNSIKRYLKYGASDISPT